MDSSTDNVDTSAAFRGNQHHGTETPRLCAAGCGFFGSAENKGLCSQCYKRHLKEANAKIEAAIVGKAQEEKLKEIGEIGGALSSLAISESESSARSRCSACRRRLGLLGFGCRCGATFCGSHRHPEEHGCTFDFKEAGKIAIQKENPICKAEKIERRI